MHWRACSPVGAVLVDVRQPDEYVEGHVADARLIPLGELPARAGEIPSVDPIYLICRSGAADRAAEYLQLSGVQAVNVVGGMLAWADGGHPVVTGPSPRERRPVGSRRRRARRPGRRPGGSTATSNTMSSAAPT